MRVAVARTPSLARTNHRRRGQDAGNRSRTPDRRAGRTHRSGQRHAGPSCARWVRRPHTWRMSPRPHLPAARRPAIAVVVATLVIAAALASLLVWGAGETLEAVSEHDGVALWDRPLLDWSIANRSATLTTGLLWFTHTGGPLWQPIITGLVALFLTSRWRDATPLVLIALTAGGALAITSAAKHVVGRARPPLADAVPPYEMSPSFPSGHTMIAVSVAGILAYLLIRHMWDHPVWERVAVGVAAAVYAAAMGFSRVFLGYHWLTDVLAAALLGVAWVGAVVACHTMWRAIRLRDASDAIEEQRKVPLRPSARSAAVRG